MRILTKIIFFGLAVICAAHLRAATIILSPTVDGSAEDFDGDGVFETLIPVSPTSDLQTFTGIKQAGRAILEFNLSTIPDLTQIQNASLLLTMTARDQRDAEVELTGYQGDGAIEVSDFTAGNLISQTAVPASLLIPITPISFDVTTFLNGILTNDIPFVGFQLSLASISTVNFASSKHTEPSWRPTLVIDYSVVPEPSTLLLALFGTVCAGVIFRSCESFA